MIKIKIYEWADQNYNNSFTADTGFTQKFRTGLTLLSKNNYENYYTRLKLIHTFQNKCIEIFRRALKDDDQLMLNWLLNETPVSFGKNYHKELEDIFYKRPVFFRTDELDYGKICEIQCPGSLWGELQLCYEFAKGQYTEFDMQSPVENFNMQLTKYLGDQPVLHYLIDNASGQPGVRYFISKSRKCTSPIKYYGIDKNINSEDVNFVRSHSVYGEWAENYFKERITKKSVQYDLPPYILFDQKATLCLPFWSKTKSYFSDEIRNIFAYTTPIYDDTLELPEGKCSIDDFSEWPRSERNYYLKYAGADVSLNWGSKAVYRLSNLSKEKCKNILYEKIEEAKRGRIWILQENIIRDEDVEYIERNGDIKKDKMRGKYSGFYGPYDFLGLLTMYRKFNKVHGQEDTVIALGIPEK